MVRHAGPRTEFRDGSFPTVRRGPARYLRVRICAAGILGRVAQAVLPGPAAVCGGAVPQRIHDRAPAGASGRAALGDTSRALAEPVVTAGTHGICHRLLRHLDAGRDSRDGKLSAYRPPSSRDSAVSDHSSVKSETLVQYRLFLPVALASLPVADDPRPLANGSPASGAVRPGHRMFCVFPVLADDVRRERHLSLCRLYAADSAAGNGCSGRPRNSAALGTDPGIRGTDSL